MTSNKKLAGVLNDLIAINNDRIEGYEKAIATIETIDIDLKTLFQNMASHSRKHKDELVQLVARLGEEIETGTTISGKIYRAWMDVKATFTGKDRTTALESCEFGEDAALKAYDEALSSDAPMSVEARQLITEQRASLKADHDKIKALRDMHQSVNS